MRLITRVAVICMGHHHLIRSVLFHRQKKTRQEPGQITVISLMRR
ncbi:hypothetical protein [Pseudomonas sp. BIC9C]|nr:hypothetical protein [Pseudomonas sp. BIC9C]